MIQIGPHRRTAREDGRRTDVREHLALRRRDQLAGCPAPGRRQGGMEEGWRRTVRLDRQGRRRGGDLQPDPRRGLADGSVQRERARDADEGLPRVRHHRRQGGHEVHVRRGVHQARHAEHRAQLGAGRGRSSRRHHVRRREQARVRDLRQGRLRRPDALQARGHGRVPHGRRRHERQQGRHGRDVLLRPSVQ